MQLNGLLASGGYPQYVRNPLSLRGLGSGKKDLESSGIFRNFRVRRAGYVLLYTILYTEMDLEVSGIFRIFVIQENYIYESNQ